VVAGRKGLWSLVEEANESLNILRGRRQPQLQANELQSPQAQATQSDLVLELRERASTFFL